MTIRTRYYCLLLALRHWAFAYSSELYSDLWFLHFEIETPLGRILRVIVVDVETGWGARGWVIG